MKRILLTILMVAVSSLLSSCACVDYGRAQQALRFRIDPVPATGAMSVMYTTRQGSQQLTPSNGVYIASLPHVKWGNIKLFGLIQVSGERHPEKSETIIIKIGNTVAEKITVAEVRHLAQGSDGAFTVKLK